MSILDWFGSSGSEQKETKRATVSANVEEDVWSVLTGDEEHKPTDRELEHAVEISSIAGPCVREVSEALSMADIESDVRTETLLSRPNPQQNFSDFIAACAKSYLSTGVVYILPRPIGGSFIDEMHVLRPSAVEVVKGPLTDPYRKITFADRRETLRLLEDDLIISLAPGFVHPAEPESPLAQAWNHVQTSIARGRAQKKIYDRLPYLLGLIETGEKTSKKQRDDLSRSMSQKIGSDVVVLPGGAEMKFPNMNINNIFDASSTLDETRICAALNVPPILVGFESGLERSTYSNYEEARKSFYQETISPLAQKFSDAFSRGLGVDVELTIDQEEFIKSGNKSEEEDEADENLDNEEEIQDDN